MLLPLLAPIAVAGDAPKDDAPSGPVGGSLAGWGAVPIASKEERQDGTEHLWAQVQVWTTVYDQDVSPEADPATYGDPEADPGLIIHRARIGLDGFVPMGEKLGRHQVDYAIALGVGAPFDVMVESDTDVQLVDGFGRWALPTSVGTSSIAMGLQRVPFSRENGMSSAFLVFEDSAVSTQWMAPARGVGAVGGQSVKFGKKDGGSELLARFGAFDTSDLFGEGGSDLLVDGRLEYSLGDTYRTFSFDRESALGLGVAAYVHQEPGLRTRAGEADLLARYKVVTVLAEVLTHTASPVDSDIRVPGVVAETGRFGWLAQLSGFVPVRPKSGIEIALRASSYDPHTAVDDGTDVLIVDGGATWRNLLPKTDVGLGYIHRAELNAESPNDTLRAWFQVRPEGRL